MDSLLVTPASEADLQLLTALFKKMKIKARVLPETAPEAKPKRATKKEAPAPATFVPQNRGERLMLEAVLELKEVLAGRKQAQSADDFLRELRELSGQHD